MSESPRLDGWRYPTFIMWLVFMAVGLAPDAAFVLLQQAAGVFRYEALIGSSLVLTVTFAAYLTVFVYLEAIAARCTPALAFANATQMGAVALVAFLPVTLEAIQFAIAMQFANLFLVSVVVLGTAAIKGIAWLYILAFLVRYYLLGNTAVFANMASFYPSARAVGAAAAHHAAASESTLHGAAAFDRQGKPERLPE